ncbi:MAG: acyl-CoA dehydrogenase family protein [Rhodospirillales bacterium]|nr:acyl-CoA dehydrogenase family protein [Rhodospirillales bacterium]
MIADGLMGEEHRIFRDTVRRFVEEELLPHREEWEAAGTVPPEVWRKAGAAGLLACDLPEEYGGFGGDFLHSVIVTEEMTRAGGGGPAFSGHSDIVVPYIARFGTEEQKRKWLPKMASGEVIGAIAMTEPSAGSDLQAMRTTARRDGDHYVIKGQKVFISNGQQAHLVVLACKTDPAPRGKGISLLLVETDRPGFSRGRMLKKIGRKAQDTVELFFDEVRVPCSNLLGQENRGFYHLMELLVQERLSSCVRGMAMTWRALEWTIDYVKEREAFGKKVSEFQNTQFELADLWSSALVHNAFLEHCIAKHLKGQLTTVEAAAAKLRITELEGQVIDRCLQFFGGWGYIWDYPIARAYADARVDRISAGSNHILKLIIGRDLLKQ